MIIILLHLHLHLLMMDDDQVVLIGLREPRQARVVSTGMQRARPRRVPPPRRHRPAGIGGQAQAVAPCEGRAGVRCRARARGHRQLHAVREGRAGRLRQQRRAHVRGHVRAGGSGGRPGQHGWHLHVHPHERPVQDDGPRGGHLPR